MKQWAKQTNGFTIVELLIVIVVIAILSAVTIVAYTGIQERTKISSLQTALSQANKKVLTYAVEHSDNYPDTLADGGVSDTSSALYQYTSNNTVSPKTYSLTVMNEPSGALSYYLSSTQPKATSGIAPGQNIIPWYKDVADAPLPLQSGTIDTTVSRTAGSKSIRLTPNSTAFLRGSTFTTIPGQVYKVEVWVLTASNWNGTSNNSKVRFGATEAGGGGLLQACSYAGVKTTWTKVTCSYTVESGVTGMTLRFANDGSTGDIWFDDISLSITGP